MSEEACTHSSFLDLDCGRDQLLLSQLPHSGRIEPGIISQITPFSPKLFLPGYSVMVTGKKIVTFVT